MKQIGARQEAGRIGGIGPCGRPLCCSSWMTSFVSVATSAARYQDISLNPQKLAGQCAKLKCCLNFEVDAYVESVKHLPSRDVKLETADATYYHFKTDIFKRELTYSTDKSIPANLVTIDANRAFEIIAMNKQGEKPLKLQRDGDKPKENKEFGDIIGQDSVTRFDKNKKRNAKTTMVVVITKTHKGQHDSTSAQIIKIIINVAIKIATTGNNIGRETTRIKQEIPTMNKLFIITLITLCLGACTSGHNTYSEFRNLPKEGWAYNDTINFIPTITDSVTQGNLSIALRHNNNYHYSNLWVEINYPINDSTIKSDTINIPLADIYGKWHGKGIGPSIQIEKTSLKTSKLTKEISSVLDTS